MALTVVELRGFEPLTPCMPCHPHPFTRPCAALPGTTPALLSQETGRGAVGRREAAHGSVADNLLTASAAEGVARLFVLVGVTGIEPVTSAV
jgi:hypothetical protein